MPRNSKLSINAFITYKGHLSLDCKEGRRKETGHLDSRMVPGYRSSPILRKRIVLLWIGKVRRANGKLPKSTIGSSVAGLRLPRYDKRNPYTTTNDNGKLEMKGRRSYYIQHNTLHYWCPQQSKTNKNNIL